MGTPKAVMHWKQKSKETKSRIGDVESDVSNYYKKPHFDNVKNCNIKRCYTMFYEDFKDLIFRKKLNHE